ncbi:flavin-containing monooxygenase FMO GS-OX-like 9 isoform X2 [Benincasa hispida]|uniref:flavin-containing monooxygenase FMO GS-OX-like 9 isoform X2 n=1 Tax=Benincasa hispida TaxID=102211 RepID=UPI001901785C|nr:flavin-containing monooxygenase FMO GS-OX-like 9 isoform X2 [Benincasa hispida]
MVSERSIIGIESLKTKKKVCVIGAGASGLVAARELRKEGHKVVILEQNDDVGGQWLYNPNVENEHPLGKSKFLNVHTSIYSSLRLASPREIMGFSDFPFVTKKGRDTRRFPGHNELLLYLKDFSQYFGLNQLIRFNTRVEYVGIMNNKNGCFGGIKDDHHLQWVVRSRDYCKYKMDNIHGNDDRDLIEQVFDAVVVATGHYSHPRLPTIKGMDKWKRKQIHSHVYRVPDPFRNEIEFLEEDGRVVFVDGTSIVADTILYCTGYSYAFPFLDTKGIVVVDDDRVGPLYEHTFPPSLAPSLSFIGIPRKLIGFPFFESQAIWIAQLLSGKRTLPSCDDMMQSIKEFYHSKDIAGIPKHNTHDLAEFEYCDKYGDNVGYPRLEEWRKKLCLTTIVNSSNNLETFRDSMDDDEDLQEAYQSPHFTQLGAQVFPLVHM